MIRQHLTAIAFVVLAAIPLAHAFAQDSDAQPEPAAPTDPTAVLKVARAANLAGDWATAEQMLASLTSNPANFSGGTIEGECLRELMLCRIHLSDYDGAMEAGNAASKFYEARDDLPSAARTMSTLGGLLRAAGRPEQAATAYAGALASFTKLDDRDGMASIRLSLGIVADMRDAWQDALEHFDAALELFRQLGDEEDVALCYRNRANALKRLKRLDEAVASCQQALFIYNQLGLEAEAAKTHCELGADFYALEDFESALSECELGLAFWRADSDEPDRADCLKGKGRALAKLERPAEALETLSSCWDLLEQAGNCDEMAALLPEIAKVLNDLGREDEVADFRDRLSRAVAASTAAGSPGGY